MAQIMFPTRRATVTEGKESGGKQGQLLGAALGGLAGAATGSPMAAVQGASVGSNLGGLVGNSIQPGSQGSVSQPSQTQGIQMQSGAVDRRLQEIQQNPHFQLQQAAAALPQLPADIQKQYAPTIEMALEASRKAQQVGRTS